MRKIVKYIFAFELVTMASSSCVFAQTAETVYFSRNGNASLSYIRGAAEIKSLYTYKAQLEDYIESAEFKASTQAQREMAARELLNAEIKDVGVRIESKIVELKAAEEQNENTDYYLSEEYWTNIELKLKSLRIAADVFRDSGNPDLESLIVSGLTEAQNLKMFYEDGSLCDEEEPETRCPFSKMIFLVDFIEKIKNDRVKNNALEIIRDFSSLQVIKENSANCLYPKDHRKQNQAKDQGMFCGMTNSNKVRKSIRNGLSYFSTGNQDPTHSCRAINLYLTKGNGHSVELDSSRESFVEDFSGHRIKIGPAEFQMLKESIK